MESKTSVSPTDQSCRGSGTQRSGKGGSIDPSACRYCRTTGPASRWFRRRRLCGRYAQALAASDAKWRELSESVGFQASSACLTVQHGLAKQAVNEDFWGLQSLDPLGHSGGGGTILGFAERYPEHASKLLLIESAPGTLSADIIVEGWSGLRYIKYST
jgi:pimeloyl-ACP methyl ester carboxylesterase